MIRWYAHAVSHIGLDPERVSQWICESYNLGHGVVPTVFWGK